MIWIQTIFTGLLLSVSHLAVAAGADSPATKVAFSADENTVTVEYSGRKLSIPRPVRSPWKFVSKGRIYWVSPTGKDTSTGSKDKPFQTFGQAISLAGPGDIIYAQPGTYTEALLLTRSGEEGKPIIVSCAPGALGQVRVTPPADYVSKNPAGAVVTVKAAQHVWVNGLVIEGPRGRPEAPKMETYGANGLTWNGKAGLGCRATNNVVFNNVHCGIKEMGHGGSGMLVEGNVIFANGTESRDHGIYMPADEVTMNGNVIFDNAGYGVHSYSKPKGQRITRNVCFENKVCGIILAGSENVVLHNVCAFNGRGIFYFRGDCKKNVVKDNIFAFNKSDGDYDNGGGKYGDPSGNTDDFNCYFPAKPDERIGAGQNTLTSDPLFRNPKAGDFRLRDGSPCRGKGVPIDKGTKTKPDIGAFQVEKKK